MQRSEARTGSIVDQLLVRKERDELAGRFRYGKSILLTDLMYRCTSGTGGMTNIQYGLDDLGYGITVVDINSFTAESKAQKFFKAIEYLKNDVMENLKHEGGVTYHIWASFAFLIGDHPPDNVWIERGFVEQFANAVREVDKRATRPIFVSVCKDAKLHGIQTGIHDVAVDSADILQNYGPAMACNGR